MLKLITAYKNILISHVFGCHEQFFQILIDLPQQVYKLWIFETFLVRVLYIDGGAWWCKNKILKKIVTRYPIFSSWKHSECLFKMMCCTRYLIYLFISGNSLQVWALVSWQYLWWRKLVNPGKDHAIIPTEVARFASLSITCVEPIEHCCVASLPFLSRIYCNLSCLYSVYIWIGTCSATNEVRFT